MTIEQPSQNFIWVPPAFGGDEGGYTFLKRILETAINTGEPVVFGDGDRVFKFTYETGLKTFIGGVQQLDSAKARGIVAHETDRNMGNYDIPLGLIELSREGKIQLQAAPKAKDAGFKPVQG